MADVTFTRVAVISTKGQQKEKRGDILHVTMCGGGATVIYTGIRLLRANLARPCQVDRGISFINIDRLVGTGDGGRELKRVTRSHYILHNHMHRGLGDHEVRQVNAFKLQKKGTPHGDLQAAYYGLSLACITCFQVIPPPSSA